MSAAAAPREGPGGSRLEPVGFESLAGWADDDHAAAFATFSQTCKALDTAVPELRPGTSPSESLLAVCRDALSAGDLSGDAARRFFESRFRPFAIHPPTGEGFLTGYYEPEVEASLMRTDAFPVPVLGRPGDLVSFSPGQTPASLGPTLSAGRRTPSGIEPYPERAAIEDGALDRQGLEILWLRDRVELFFAQVQGSARARLPDGRVVRLVYAGRNGRPYTSIGKVVVAEGHMRLEDMTLESFKGWLRDHEAEARRIMRMNASYIFFALRDDLDPAKGPIGAASVPLVPLRSIAVDRTLWAYGLPFWIDADLPDTAGGPSRFARLMVAQDTGSAILGPARADIFFGSGAEAGRRAGNVRHPGRFVVLLPRGGHDSP
jgi:membrane-bound lytic murein transglycosylase A